MPNYSDGEETISQIDGALHGQWHQTWVTNLGIHVRKMDSLRFFPYSGLTGTYEKSEFWDDRNKQPKGKLFLYQKGELLHRINLHYRLGLSDRIRDAALEERAKGFVQQAKTIDESMLLENVLEHSKQVDGFFKHYSRLKRSGRKGIEKLLGEQSTARIGGGANLQYYVNPVFVFPNWVVGIQDGVKGRKKSVEPAVTLVYKPEVIFWYLFRYIRVTETASNYGRHISKHLDWKKSFLLLCTPHTWYRFSRVIINPRKVYRTVLSG